MGEKMNKEEFAKKVIEIVQTEGKKAVELIKDLNIAEASVACHYILVGWYSEAKEHALLHEIYDAVHFVIIMNLGVFELISRLEKVEQIYKVKPNYDKAFETIVKYLK